VTPKKAQLIVAPLDEKRKDAQLFVVGQLVDYFLFLGRLARMEA
jgi:hypothetical protein